MFFIVFLMKMAYISLNKFQIMKTEHKKINFGYLLSYYTELRFIRSDKLAGLIGKTSQSIANYKSATSLKSETIEEICYALEHNFFQDMANQLPREFTVNAELDAANQSLIAQLQEENKVLKIENDLLMRMKG